MPIAPRRSDRLRSAAHRLLIDATRWSRHRKLLVSIGIDAALLALGLTVVVLSFSDLCGCEPANIQAAPLILLGTGMSIAVLFAAGAYRHVLRHWSVRPMLVVLGGSGLAAVTSTLLLGYAFARPMLLVYAFPLLWIVGLGPLVVWRLLGSALLFQIPRRAAQDSGAPLVVYGAGVAGAELVAGLQREADYKVVALVDDDPDMQGRTVHGCPIIPPTELEELLARKAVDQVVVAIPSATVEERRRVLDRLAHFPVRVRTLPPLSAIVSGESMVSEIREVTAEELLSREPVKPDVALLRQELAGKSVMVTGGGGSIGSALCREILRHGPARLVVFEVSEFALYTIDRELRELARTVDPAVEIRSVLGSVLSPRDVGEAIAANRVDIVYHAAAYKHVPLVEANPMRGVENNVLGTLHVAEAAQRLGVSRFVLISTDKAVRPTNVMGASKRVAEKLLEGLSHVGGPTRFTLVRFGNVIDSAGSVVPLFREQIRRGGPVTVTHPDVTRYFMTIPEAAELVIQAGAMAKEGVEVFHLDMGEPVRVADLARKMIHLSGHHVAGSGSGDTQGKPGIEIRFIGLRPGEKLYEELLVTGGAEPTAHPRIFRARDVSATWPVMQRHLLRLREAVERNDVKLLKQVLRDCVEDYREAESRSVPVPAAERGAPRYANVAV